MKILQTAIMMAPLLALLGCSGETGASTAPQAAATEAPAAVRNASHVVTLDGAAQRDVGIVVREVEMQSMPEAVQATGRITINEESTWRVGAVTDGRIVEIDARIGDRVERGQVLARMHSHDIHESRAEFQRAVSDLDRLKSQLTYAQSVRDRTRRLYDLKAASLQQVEQSEAEVRNAETALRNGEVELERARKHLEEFLGVPAEAPESDANGADTADLIPILAPAAGTLLERNVTSGTMVGPTGDLFVITDLSTLWMIAEVSEENLSKLRVGTPVHVVVQAYPDRTFDGRLAMLGTELDPTTRTIMARVELPNGRRLLKPEMYGTAEIDAGGSRQAIYIPETAVQEINGESAVFVQSAPNDFTARTVSTVSGGNGNVEVTDGLQPGDRIAVEGGFLLKSQLMKSSLSEE